MAIRKVARLGHPVLRKRAALVVNGRIGSPEINQLVQDMVETMFEYDGRGLAAPQVHESLRIVVMLWEHEKTEKKPSLLCLINPVIKPITKAMSSYWEGCLSVPGMRGKVTRPNQISLSASGIQGEKIQMDVSGFDATVIQHECDHLDGILYVDRIKDMKDFAYTDEYERYTLPGDPDSEGADE